MDKILQPQTGEGTVEVTNDGATILKSILVENPAAKILIGTHHHNTQYIFNSTIWNIF